MKIGILKKEMENAERNSSNWLIFWSNRLLVRQSGGAVFPVTENPKDLGLTLLEHVVFPSGSGPPRNAGSVQEPGNLPGEYTFLDLRSLASLTDRDLFCLAGKAYQLLFWEETNRFCGRCGTPLGRGQEEYAKRCDACGLHIFPPVTPAIIIGVVNNNTLLLAHNARFPDGLYSLVAGFMEPGETIEQCARREVAEETGIDIEDIRYFGSQPWPFPHSLMIGLTGKYAGGSIRPDGMEITDAAWFSPQELPKLPPQGSISREIIDWFIRSNHHDAEPET